MWTYKQLKYVFILIEEKSLIFVYIFLDKHQTPDPKHITEKVPDFYFYFYLLYMYVYIFETKKNLFQKLNGKK